MSSSLDDLDPKLVSDWTIPEDEDADAIAYPSGERVAGHPSVEMLRSACKEAYGKTAQDEFRVYVDNQTFRVRREHTHSGVRYFLRSFGPAVQLSPKTVPHHIIKQLLSEKLSSGGLILVSGATGVGKTTTTSSAVITRLAKFGGVAWAIEDPSEYDMEGPHGNKNGVCWQKSISQGGFAQAMRNVMRCYPAGPLGVLMVGEVRDKETADQCLRAAMNGLLVIATIHANSITGAIDRLIGMSSENDRMIARQILSMSLRLIIHQARKPTEPGRITFRSLWVSQDSQTTSAIRDGDITTLKEQMQFQSNKIRMGTPLC